MTTAHTATPWKVRTARVSRRCVAFHFANSCGREIHKGEKFYQSEYRAGLDHAEVCVECADRWQSRHLSEEEKGIKTVPFSYAIRLAQAFAKLKFTMEWLRCTQDEAIAEVAREFSVQPEDVEAAALANAGAA